MTRLSAVFRPAILAAFLTSVAMPACADILVFTDEDSFLTAVTNFRVDGFDDLTSEEIATPLSRLAGAYEYRIAAGPSDRGLYPVTTGTNVYIAPTLASDVITFDGFSSSVSGFGGSFFATDAYGASISGMSLQMTATDGTGIATYTMTGSSPSSFLGFLSSLPLLEISMRTIDEQGNVYWATANDIVIAADVVTAVPEPSTFAIFGAGIVTMAASCRRRRFHA